MSDVIIHTELGDIEFDFFDHCPDAVGNFVDLAMDGKYDNSEFDTLIRDFIVQGGNVVEDIKDDYILDEYSDGVKFDRPYLVACAGRGDFSHPSIFFITLRAADHLDWHHTIFGEVKDEKSQEVLHEMNSLKQGSTVIIRDIEIVEQS